MIIILLVHICDIRPQWVNGTTIWVMVPGAYELDGMPSAGNTLGYRCMYAIAVTLACYIQQCTWSSLFTKLVWSPCCANSLLELTLGRHWLHPRLKQVKLPSLLIFKERHFKIPSDKSQPLCSAAHFTNNFPIVIKIRWKFIFSPIQIVEKWSL